MTEPVVPLITLIGAPGASCEGDDCLVDGTTEPAKQDDQQYTPPAQPLPAT